VNESLPELIPFNQQVHQVLSDARPQTPGIYRFCFPEGMLLALLETAPAVQSICLLGGYGNAGMRPERQCKSGMEGGLTAASFVSPFTI